jgi:hypothetical protein
MNFGILCVRHKCYLVNLGCQLEASEINSLKNGYKFSNINWTLSAPTPFNASFTSLDIILIYLVSLGKFNNIHESGSPVAVILTFNILEDIKDALSTYV